MLERGGGSFRPSDRFLGILFIFDRGTPFKDTLPTFGWWKRFTKRHPQLRLRTPSLIDPGRSAMSRSSILNRYFEEAKRFLCTLDILNDPDKILNIDETWYCEKGEKSQKVVTTAQCKVPYKVYGERQSHTTLTMCVSASGKWLPSMITFQGNIPKTELVHETGPKDTLYSNSASGHIDTELYLQYIRHIEPFLCRRRPLAIFQDNLSCHENLDLVEFCLEKNIHLFNLPSKSSHLVQPLDKLFGLLKTKIEEVKHEVVVVQQRNTNRSQVPVLVRFAMNRISASTIRDSFRNTGLCPLDHTAIGDSLLLNHQEVAETQTNRSDSHTDNHVIPRSEDAIETDGLSLEVFDDDGHSIDVQSISDKVGSKETQKDPIVSTVFRLYNKRCAYTSRRDLRGG